LNSKYHYMSNLSNVSIQFLLSLTSILIGQKVRDIAKSLKILIAKKWSNGGVEQWSDGVMEEWKDGRMEKNGYRVKADN